MQNFIILLEVLAPLPIISFQMKAGYIAAFLAELLSFGMPCGDTKFVLETPK